MSVPSKVLPSALALTTLTLPLFISLGLVVLLLVLALVVLVLEKGLMDSVGALVVAGAVVAEALPPCCLASDAAAPCNEVKGMVVKRESNSSNFILIFFHSM